MEANLWAHLRGFAAKHPAREPSTKRIQAQFQLGCYPAAALPQVIVVFAGPAAGIRREAPCKGTFDQAYVGNIPVGLGFCGSLKPNGGLTRICSEPHPSLFLGADNRITTESSYKKVSAVSARRSHLCREP